jgi:hypothetical protein
MGRFMDTSFAARAAPKLHQLQLTFRPTDIRLPGFAGLFVDEVKD